MTAPFARKRFGQHFLTRADVGQRIVSLAQLGGSETVLEIGPGRGALTRGLAAKCGRLVLVEVDRDLAEGLRPLLAEYPHIELHVGDILDMDLAELLGDSPPATVVANLPYNISTPVMMYLLDAPERFARLVLMLQREVAERLCAGPGSRIYGGLSVVVQTVATARIALRVPASAFAPVPKVESAVVVLEPRHPAALDAEARRALRTVVRAAFSRRRKQLSNAIGGLTDDPHGLLASLGFEPTRRPETLSPAEFVRLAAAWSALHA